MTRIARLGVVTALWCALSVYPVTAAPYCGPAKVTGYNLNDPTMNDYTFDGTPTWTDEPIVAASRDVEMGSIVEIVGLGTYRVADRGSGLHMRADGAPHIDVAVRSNAAAYAITGEYSVCIRRP